MHPTPYDRAALLAATALAGVTDRQGDPYIAHVLRVSHDCVGEDAQIVGLLHDVVEWGDLAPAALRDAGFAEHILTAVAALTRGTDEPLEQHVARILACPLALRVKLADLRDNSATWRLAKLDAETQSELLEKYHRTAALLGTTLEAVHERTVIPVQLHGAEHARATAPTAP